MSKAAPTEEPHDLDCLTIAELEKHAAQRMTKQTKDYYDEGADSGSTLRENMSAYQKYRIRPRVLRDISSVDTGKTIFGHRNSVPFGVAPTAMQCLAHPDGELATAGACKNAGVVMGLSSFATTSLEDVAAANGDNPYVLQLYLFEEREHTIKMLRRAKAAGYKAVFLTVDTPMLGRRNLDLRNQFKLPKPYRIANFEQDSTSDEAATVMGNPPSRDDKQCTEDGVKALKGDHQQHQQDTSQVGYLHPETRKRIPPSGKITFHTHAANPTLNWENDIAWLKEQCGSSMQVWVKGIATAEDALLAVHYGVDGIVVSNHGGRQLDGALATIDALPEVVQAVQGKIPVHVDGGVRRGTDVFKALALGADFVWIGRPVLWGLAYKGQEGVELCLRLLRDEIRLCMGLAGTVKCEEINRDYLMRIDSSGFVSRL
jgi:(S)-2-hydroxy-acid oxidase